MSKVLSFTLHGEHNELVMPVGSTLLRVAYVGADLVLYVEAPEAPLEERVFQTFSTYEELPSPCRYAGTDTLCQQSENGPVFTTTHVYEVFPS